MAWSRSGWTRTSCRSPGTGAEVMAAERRAEPHRAERHEGLRPAVRRRDPAGTRRGEIIAWNTYEPTPSVAVKATIARLDGVAPATARSCSRRLQLRRLRGRRVAPAASATSPGSSSSSATRRAPGRSSGRSTKRSVDAATRARHGPLDRRRHPPPGPDRRVCATSRSRPGEAATTGCRGARRPRPVARRPGRRGQQLLRPHQGPGQAGNWGTWHTVHIIP